MTIHKTLALIAVLVLIVGAIIYLESRKVPFERGAENSTIDVIRTSVKENIERIKDKEGQYLRAKELTQIAGYINTPDTITITNLIGKKVILIDFWTYSCINCQRTLPFITSWYEKYKDQGLEVIGVHTPEFKFEQEIENVRQAVTRFGVTYPVVLDNDYATWHAYNNRYWPRKYIIDIDGFIVYDHIGEGAYSETEKIIQKLLEERKKVLGANVNIASDISRPDNVERVSGLEPRSPEIYFGAWRNDRLRHFPCCTRSFSIH